MKGIIKYWMALSIGVILACNADSVEVIELPKIDVEDPTVKGALEFDVEVTEIVKDTVRFQLSGNPDLIDFYSGTFGNAYDYIDKDRFYDIMANLSFRSGKSPDNGSPENYDCAELLYSTDFNGEREDINAYASVKAATWIPITDRFELPQGKPEGIAVYKESGVKDVSDIFAEGKPVYLAWHCTTQAESSRVQFRVIESSIQGVVIDNSSLSTELYKQAEMDFKWVENQASAEQPASRPTVSTTQVNWNGIFNNKTSNTNSSQQHPRLGQFKEGYAISKALELPRFNAGKDKPTLLTPKNDGNWGEYEFIYDKPGVYEVVFVASNVRDGGEPIMKTFTVTIAE
ncbi:DUF5017 domain-containing protein [Sphingobacterium sp. SGG-5]|uniref:DUF5017 domain-containing protein n=1 Tax=Sphingobacterium sp. SGG-5 TaxID=2710881 RepID=UPI0013EC1D89|nr:DUF5017 domain-containing protein [Sphingobacterium sp. SGG-5]NGM61343.1 DUF5017 domain-containing protein [Sphingobacterium sp. SGG-5]